MNMRFRPGRLAVLLVLLGVCGPAFAAPESSPAGLWDATVDVRGLIVPFKFEVSGSGASWKGSFFDGDLRQASTSGSYSNGALVLKFDQYGAKVDVVFKDDRLEGVYNRGTRGAPYPFKAVRTVPAAPLKTPVPSIAGEWRVLLNPPSTLGEQSWRMVVRQSGARASAAIMRIDGDTGTMDGTYKDGTFLLGHFFGAGPAVLVITPATDGSLTLLQDGVDKMIAVRPTDARAKAALAPIDPTMHLRVKDPAEKLRFSFPDLDGRIVSNTDARFQGKVVIVSITGTWCPNCHDEAPFLAKLYQTYRGKGLEMVALSFEEPDQLKDLSRVRSFIAHYGIAYPFLLAGEPSEAAAKLPQAVNLNTFPATFILGKDGRVRATHAGYASKATGNYYSREQKQFIAEIDRLLAER